MWEGNLLSQKLGINNLELAALMTFLERGIETGAVTKADTGLSSIPATDRRSEPEYGGDTAHHQFLEEFLGGIAYGTSPFAQGTGRAAELFGDGAVDLYHAMFAAWGNKNHHFRGVAEALHWATDTRDPFNSCHDYVIVFGKNQEIAAWFGVPGGYLEGENEGKHQNIYQDTERETVWVQNHQCLRNSLLICEFASMPSLFFHPPEVDIRIFESKLLSMITGVDMSVERLWETGERIWHLRRAIMVLRENRQRHDDTISRIWFEPKNDHLVWPTLVWATGRRSVECAEGSILPLARVERFHRPAYQSQTGRARHEGRCRQTAERRQNGLA